MLRQTLSFWEKRSQRQPAAASAAFGVFLHYVCMFSTNTVAKLCALLVLITATSAQAQQMGAVYEAKAGDCLSGIVKAHYPNVTGHFFVLHSNPDIVDENQIEIGQGIVLPGLTADQISSNVDQTGCNAASIAARLTAKSTVAEKAATVASTRVTKEPTVASGEERLDVQKHPGPNPATANFAELAASNVSKGVAAAGVEAVASTIPVQPEAKQAVINPTPVGPTPSKKPTRGVSGRQSVVAGTRAVPIDSTQRTVAVPARGRPTRASAPTQSQPLFAVDDDPTMPSHAYRQSTPNRYVVNAIGARTLTASTALVQHPDQHFYVESRADWHDAMSGHALERSNTAPAPVSDTTSKPATALEEALAQREQPKTQSAGNIFIDESLLLKAAAKSGGNP